MTKQIHLAIGLNDGLGITSVVITHNDTQIANNHELIEAKALALLKSILSNKSSLKLQDLLSELDVELVK